MIRSRRALLYVPASDWGKIEKAAGLGADSVCLDLEDGVAPNKKIEAREQVVRAFNDLDFGRSERLIRINSVGSGIEDDDLLKALSVQPDGIVLPKVSSGDQVRAISLQITDTEQREKMEPNQIRLIAQIESALGLVNIKEIASADERLDALIFGSEDYASDVGAKRTVEGDEIFYARSAVVAHAAAFGLQAIDMLWTNFKDIDGLKRVVAQGAELGYSGMQIIHPDQIEPVHIAFTPSAEEIKSAQRIIDAYEDSVGKGKGAFALDGKMVDMPIVKGAQRVLARAHVK